MYRLGASYDIQYDDFGRVTACRRDKMAFRERELAEPMPSFSLGLHGPLGAPRPGLSLLMFPPHHSRILPP